MIFEVLYRKQTNKKHKTFDGDGVLEVNSDKINLYSDEGVKMFTTATRGLKVEVGNLLLLCGKEIEVSTVIPDSDFASGKCFSTRKVAVTKKLVMKPFVKPGVNQTVAKKVKPEPKHDPNADGAVVMPKPADKDAVDVVLDPVLGRQLRQYQKEGVQFIYSRLMQLDKENEIGPGVILADHMGLGKTLQIIAVIWTMLKQNPVATTPIVQRVLIVCPATLVKNWQNEFKKWLGNERIKTFAVGVESLDQAAKESDNGAVRDFIIGERIYPVLITSYEKLRTIYDMIKSVKFDMIVCDEGHRLKSVNIKTTKVVQQIKCSKRVVLTGTPIQNDLSEFFAMADFVNPGILGSAAAFKQVYSDVIMKGRRQGASKEEVDLGQARSSQLQKLSNAFILRRTAEVNHQHLPPKTEVSVFCRLTALQQSIYSDILRSSLLGFLRKTKISAGEHLTVLTALRKLVNSPQILFDSASENPTDEVNAVILDVYRKHTDTLEVEDSSKLQVLQHMLQQVSQQFPNDKVVVISNFTQTLDAIEKILDCQYFRLDGSTQSNKRMDLVDRFNDPTHPSKVFLLSSKSGGTGLNLIGASRLILYDLSWNPADDAQAMARIWRQGQQAKHVYIYRLLAAGCIDEKIFQRSAWKSALSDSIIDASESLDKFSMTDLRKIFTLSDSACETYELNPTGKGMKPEQLGSEVDPVLYDVIKQVPQLSFIILNEVNKA